MSLLLFVQPPLGLEKATQMIGSFPIPPALESDLIPVTSQALQQCGMI